MSSERIKKGDLFWLGRDLAIVMKVGKRDVSFVYLNRHIPGTARYEQWTVNKKSIRMNMVSSA